MICREDSGLDSYLFFFNDTATTEIYTLSLHDALPISGKNLGAYGDAGSIISNDDEFARKARMFANHGSLKKHEHEFEGINSRMDGLQAAILSVKLPYIHEWNQKRLQNSLLYNELLRDVEGVVTPKIRSNAKHVFHLYVIRTKKRDELQK